MSSLSIDLYYPLADFNLELSFEIPTQGISVIYGKSGSGKTTLLRCIAGIEKASTAKIIFENHIWQDQKLFIPTHHRNLGYVFQESNLFSHLNVNANLDYAIKRSQAKYKFLKEEIIEIFNLQHLINRDISKLSGGERQRVAMARAILSNPNILLMDEPLASLDEENKIEIMSFLKNVQRKYNIPIIYVTHSNLEISQIADRVIFMQNGKIVKINNINNYTENASDLVQLQ